MIDTATIFFSTLMCLFVVFRAVKLDGQIPWFGRKQAAAPDARKAALDEAWMSRDAP